ncbi:MAG TPA: nucleotidyl transferase AbiEii/AbiGii toxin family protein [Ktedonobacterales bacterium]
MSDSTSGKTPRDTRAPKDLSASIRGRLKNQARARGEDMLYVLSRYALERLLYRLGRSPYTDQFVVKGALLFSLWSDLPHRPTRDLDLLGFGSEDANRIQTIFSNLCAAPVDMTDGLTFQPETVQVTSIRGAQAYGGLRVAMWALLGQTRIRVQVDIGFGDVVTPAATYADFPSLIGLPSPHVRVYPPETVVAEKYEALVRLGMINSRVKDFYDLWTLAHERTFTGAILAAAIQATFTRRGTPLPVATPVALTEPFITDPAKLQLWHAFVSRNKLNPAGPTLAATAELLHAFLLPPTQSLLSGESFDQQWTPDGPW